MTFAFDFDGFLTACPYLWVPTIKLAQAQGWKAVIATGRSNRDGQDREDIEAFLFTHGLTGIDIYFCGSRPKRTVLQEAGVEVAGWIDDNPVMVDLGYDGLAMVGEYHGCIRRGVG